MNKAAISNRQKSLLFTAIATVILMFAASLLAAAQDLSQTYTVGELIEVKWAETWLKAKIVEEKNGRYTIVYEVDGATNFVYKDRMRPLAGAKTQRKQTQEVTGRPEKTPAETNNDAQKGVNKYKLGDRVECDRTYMNSWEKGTVVKLRKTDPQDGKMYRVLLDSYAKAGLYLDGHDCYVDAMRLLAGAAPFKNDATAIPVGKTTVDEDNTVSADRPILECPTEQSPVKNPATPNLELFKKIIRCNKGEKAAAKGSDGAVTVDVTALKIGTPRFWIYGQDLGGKPGTKIYPVKATFHYKTFYRSGTQVSQNWIKILNFYVNAFGEWEIGSEESIKMGETVNIPKD
jgi:hypothetical protein